jgi:cytochrome c
MLGAKPDDQPGDVSRGQVVFNQCAVCHDTHAATAPNPGPDLHGVVGRRAGSLPGYRYSRAMRNARRSWTEAALDAYIADPQTAVPGNTMPFPGIADATQRRDLIAYLKTLK